MLFEFQLQFYVSVFDLIEFEKYKSFAIEKFKGATAVSDEVLQPKDSLSLSKALVNVTTLHLFYYV